MVLGMMLARRCLHIAAHGHSVLLRDDTRFGSPLHFVDLLLLVHALIDALKRRVRDNHAWSLLRWHVSLGGLMLHIAVRVLHLVGLHVRHGMNILNVFVAHVVIGNLRRHLLGCHVVRLHHAGQSVRARLLLVLDTLTKIS